MYHGVLQQVLQFAEAAALVTGVLPLDGFLELPKIRLTVPGVAHELIEDTNIKTLRVKVKLPSDPGHLGQLGLLGLQDQTSPVPLIQRFNRTIKLKLHKKKKKKITIQEDN